MAKKQKTNAANQATPKQNPLLVAVAQTLNGWASFKPRTRRFILITNESEPLKTANLDTDERPVNMMIAKSNSDYAELLRLLVNAINNDDEFRRLLTATIAVLHVDKHYSATGQELTPDQSIEETINFF